MITNEKQVWAIQKDISEKVHFFSPLAKKIKLMNWNEISPSYSWFEFYTINKQNKKHKTFRVDLLFPSFLWDFILDKVLNKNLEINGKNKRFNGANIEKYIFQNKDDVLNHFNKKVDDYEWNHFIDSLKTQDQYTTKSKTKGWYGSGVLRRFYIPTDKWFSKNKHSEIDQSIINEHITLVTFLWYKYTEKDLRIFAKNWLEKHLSNYLESEWYIKLSNNDFVLDINSTFKEPNYFNQRVTERIISEKAFFTRKKIKIPKIDYVKSSSASIEEVNKVILNYIIKQKLKIQDFTFFSEHLSLDNLNDFSHNKNYFLYLELLSTDIEKNKKINLQISFENNLIFLDNVSLLNKETMTKYQKYYYCEFKENSQNQNYIINLKWKISEKIKY
ncbi:hypothetical protein [Mesomycoplasma neurolyticum]|uniref:Uncharacterized protein n=1 Tax=Mesomycoplasma neurolyticum TaxID=2120 RepID=A0A449A5L3_9BACT|nr:hypothetical protein [Mesomycoplasma neurolyticum]VEU59443.1 Uncharacterised protein [Mesomycoplasma neurolyticum]